ncbi:MAG: Arc family DNA-binding protein [Gammaproteobacteria bacterium]|nr:Arc family DNA-binding protein [Gammaproteobacteria bacterium]
MSAQIKQFALRLPEELKDRLQEVAAINGRSLNSEIVYRLTYSFEEQSTKAAIDAVQKDMKKKGLVR